jgi:hypothetical protein
MKALLIRLATMKADLNIWFDRLSNWQFVAVAAAVSLCRRCPPSGAAPGTSPGRPRPSRWSSP